MLVVEFIKNWWHNCQFPTTHRDEEMMIRYTTKEHSKCSTWRNIPSPVTMPITTNNMQYQLVCLCTSSGSWTDSICQKCKNSYYHILKFLLCTSISVFNSHCWEGTWTFKLPKIVKSLLKFQNRMRLGSVNTILIKHTLTLRWLMSYIYGAPILDVSRSHTTTQHSR